MRMKMLTELYAFWGDRTFMSGIRQSLVVHLSRQAGSSCIGCPVECKKTGRSAAPLEDGKLVAVPAHEIHTSSIRSLTSSASRVTSADTGCGIAAANLHKVVEPFFTTKSRGGSGSGLSPVKNSGLSRVKDVVQKHDGSLRVRSRTKPGRSGRIFTIFLSEASASA